MFENGTGAMLDDAYTSGAFDDVIEMFVRGATTRTGARYGLAAAEEFRVVRFGGLMGLLERFGARFGD